MASAALAVLDLAPPRLYRFTVEDYHALGRAGILHEDSRVELIDGQIIAMSLVGRPHLLTVNRPNRVLVLAGERAIVSVQNPVRLDDGTEPEPDLALLRLDAEDHFPTAADALLVIEVADATEAYGRNVKLPRYAAAGVLEVWLVLVGEDHGARRDPSPTGADGLRRGRAPRAGRRAYDRGPARPRRRRARGRAAAAERPPSERDASTR